MVLPAPTHSAKIHQLEDQIFVNDLFLTIAVSKYYRMHFT